MVCSAESAAVRLCKREADAKDRRVSCLVYLWLSRLSYLLSHQLTSTAWNMPNCEPVDHRLGDIRIIQAEIRFRTRFKEWVPVRRTLVSTYRRQVDALVRHRDEGTGLWHTLIVDPTSYVESSAAAGFAGGMYCTWG